MPLESLGFAGGTLDRAANQRGDKAWLAAQRAHPAARLVKLSGDRARLAAGGLMASSGAIPENALLLGLDDHETPVFAAEAEDPFADGIDLRSIAVQGLLPASDQALLAQARALLHWHQRHGFCAHCGEKTAIADAGYRRHCLACAADHFPRTDPVVIMVVRHQGRCLLGRQSFWAPGMYSALAGFMEPGETIEDAARREVFEEAGIRVGATAYVKSQPWPFPSSLMIGLLGEALNDDISRDGKELEDARWFEGDELRAMLSGTHPLKLKCPPPMAIAHHLIAAALHGS